MQSQRQLHRKSGRGKGGTDSPVGIERCTTEKVPTLESSSTRFVKLQVIDQILELPEIRFYHGVYSLDESGGGGVFSF